MLAAETQIPLLETGRGRRHTQGLDCKTLRTLAALPSLPHCHVGGFDVAAKSVAVEQRMRLQVLRKPGLDRVEERSLPGQPQCERLVLVEAVGDELGQTH